MDDFIVSIKDARALGYCSRGQREFCKRHNIDFLTFVREGIPASQFMETQDHQAIRMVEAAMNRRKE